jgi:hypothetical protein
LVPLGTFADAATGKGGSAEDRIPLIRCDAPVHAGSTAKVTLRVANEEPASSEVTLYCSHLIADCGYEIPALRVAISPRTATIAANGEAPFEIAIAVPQQAPRGVYSGLFQAMGSKYVKAVVSVEVL